MRRSGVALPDRAYCVGDRTAGAATAEGFAPISAGGDAVALIGIDRDPEALARANKRFHRQIHLASHNRYLVQQLDLVHRTMALMARTSLAAEGRGETALAEHARIVEAIAVRNVKNPPKK